MDLVKTIKAARAVATPLLAVETSDVWATADAIVEGLDDRTPVVCWDVVRGFVGLNDLGQAVVRDTWQDAALDATAIPAVAVREALKLPGDQLQGEAIERLGAVLLLVNPQRHFNEAELAQGLGNFREPFKRTRRTAILLGPSIALPAELHSDVVLLQEPLPSDAELQRILLELYETAELEAPGEELVEGAVDAARGLSAFAAEQVFAMSLADDGLDLSEAWERKRAAVNQQQGLSLTLPSEASVRFSDLRGLDGIQGLVRRIANGKRRPRAVVFIDEIEKLLAGAGGGDLSGVSDDQLQVLLTFMEDKEATGMILVGPPGVGKTALAKALSAEFRAPMVSFDTGAMKGSLVGSSEALIRGAMRTVEGIGGDRVLFVATSNNVRALRTELLRRFKLGIWFFDLPSAEQLDEIWKVYQDKFRLDEDQVADRPEAKDWTGAEVRNACELADGLNCTLREASAYIVPVARSDAQGIHRLREAASGRYLNAQAAGTYDQVTVDVGALQGSLQQPRRRAARRRES